MQVDTKATLQYAILPGILPRTRRLFGSGFSFVSSLMAQIYGMVGLLPAGHPYLNPLNKGRFGIHHVIAEAANNLELNRKNLDKIFVFFALVIGAIILFMQFALLAGMFILNYAWAGPLDPSQLFDTVNPENDIAFNLLTLIFGIPNLYCSSSAPATCAAANATIVATPFPIHTGLHELLRFYSFGLLLIGVLIFLYYVVVVVAETAMTGSPFGRRFQNVWVPIRLVVALGLLVPINYGLNTGQYITLYAAKLGSSIATYGWLHYNSAIEEHTLFGGDGNGANPIGERETLIAIPKRISVAPLVKSMSLIHTCAYSYWHTAGETPVGSARTFAAGHYHYNAGQIPAPAVDPIKIRAWFIKNGPIDPSSTGLAAATRYEVRPGTTVAEALDFYGNGNIIIRFGEYVDSSQQHEQTGEVKPYCGDIVIPVVSVAGRPGGTPAGPAIGTAGSSAAMMILQLYLNTVKTLWFRDATNTPSDRLKRGAIFFYENTNNIPTRFPRVCSAMANPPQAACSNAVPGIPNCTEMLSTGPVENRRVCSTSTPGKEWIERTIDEVQTSIDPEIVAAWNFYVQNADLEIETEILDRGWAGAGIWFNRLADLNGSFQDSITALPVARSMPLIMEQTRDYLQQHDPGADGGQRFRPYTSQGARIQYPGGDTDANRAAALYKNFQALTTDGTAGGDPEKEVVYNFFMDAMNIIFGTDGIFDMRGANVHVHPLVQLIMIGKGLVESTIRNLAVATGFSFMGGIAKVASGSSSSLFSAISGFIFSTSFFGLTAGIVLFYVVPFLPFIYFFFAVASWVKTIFEAMVGVPLWALAHLRLDGEGLPGDGASNGYFLIFEIGLRPILTIVGLVAAIVIFTAQVRVLNFIWDIVVENAAGFSDAAPEGFTLDPGYFDDAGGVLERDGFKRGIIDQFFYTIIYTIVVYLMATASFKLIDALPDNILRWGGAGVSSFNDTNQESIEGVQRYVAMGGMVQGEQITQGVMGAAEGAGSGFAQGLGLRGVLSRNVPPPVT